MKQLIRFAMGAGLVLVLLVACSGANEEEAADTLTPETPDTTAGTGEVVAGEAPVDSVEVLVLESFPVQVNVIVSGNLPDGCTRLEEPTVEGPENNLFNVTLPTMRPTDAVCTEALEPYDKVIQLDVEGLPAGTYTVDVNGVTSDFTLSVDNELSGAETAEPGESTEVGTGTGAISGRVWHDLCAIAGGEGDEEATPSEGCVPVASGGFQADGVEQAGEPGIEGVEVALAEGACPGSPLATATTNADGYYSFTALQAGTYCISVDPVAETNVAALVPGAWTFPPGDGPVEAEVTVVAGQVQPDINFGWDFEFLPEPGDTTAVTETETTETPVATTKDCTDAADFVSDVTIPDDTVISAGTSFTKTWRLINTGTCTWTTDYSLVFHSGEQMGGSEEIPLRIEVPPESVIDLSVQLEAPAVNGQYRGNWILENELGQEFGIPEPDVVFWVQIVVQDGEEAPAEP